MSNVVDKETAKVEYERWCSAWKIGKKRKYMKGDELDQAETQEEMIIDMIMEGRLSLGDNNELLYTMEDPTNSTSELTIPRPKGDIIMSGDRFNEAQTGHKAVAMVAAATGLAEKIVSGFEYNTDVSNLMAVIGHFLTA